MARSDILQVKGIATILSGGYDGEPVDAQPAFANWEYVDENSNGVESYYFYCDSNPESNLYRSQTNVTVKTKWTSHVDDMNNVVIHTDTFLIRIDRIARPGAMPEWDAPASNGDAPGAGRDIYVFRPNAPCNINAAVDHWYAPYNYDGNIFTGELYLGSDDKTLAPAETTGVDSAIIYRNVVSGYVAHFCGDNGYVDAMALGFQFRNNLPKDLPIPVWVDTAQTPDICENFVNVSLFFAGPPVNGAEIYVEWRYDGQDWSSERSASAKAFRNEQVEVVLSPIAPTNHTSSPQKVYFRAKFRPRGVKMNEGDWLYGEFFSRYVPAPNMSVPDITMEECTSIGKGDLIPEFDKDQCYNEVACADTDIIRDKIKDLDWEKNAECRAMNGDTSTKGDS